MKLDGDVFTDVCVCQLTSYMYLQGVARACLSSLLLHGSSTASLKATRNNNKFVIKLGQPVNISQINTCTDL